MENEKMAWGIAVIALTLAFAAIAVANSHAGITENKIGAENVTIVDNGSYYTSDNVEGALQEVGLLGAENTLIWTALHDINEALFSASWWDENWSRRRSITISPLNSENYQLKIVVPYDSDMRSDYGDLRFMENENAGVLSYWIENYTVDNVTVWVRRLENANGTIYMYYGNASATSAENGNNTFIFFDDFSGTSIDTAKWPNRAGTISVSGGQVSVTNTDYPAYIQSAVIVYPFVFEAKLDSDTAVEEDDMRMGFDLRTAIVPDPQEPGYWWYYKYWYLQGTATTITESPIVLPKIIGVCLKTQTSADTFRDRTALLSSTALVGVGEGSTPVALQTGYIAQHTSKWDWALVRKLPYSMPTTSVGGEETFKLLDGKLDSPLAVTTTDQTENRALETIYQNTTGKALWVNSFLVNVEDDMATYVLEISPNAAMSASIAIDRCVIEGGEYTYRDKVCGHIHVDYYYRIRKLSGYWAAELVSWIEQTLG